MTQPLTPRSISHRRMISKRRRTRFIMIIIGIVVLAAAVALVLYALRGTTSFFRMPSEVTADDIQSHRPLRLGGFVEKGSVQYSAGAKVNFIITDYTKTERVEFTGILPDLFREQQGVIVEGHFENPGDFIASRVLAKHDENYIPKDIADRLKQQGLWKE